SEPPSRVRGARAFPTLGERLFPCSSTLPRREVEFGTVRFARSPCSRVQRAVDHARIQERLACKGVAPRTPVPDRRNQCVSSRSRLRSSSPHAGLHSRKRAPISRETLERLPIRPSRRSNRTARRSFPIR